MSLQLIINCTCTQCEPPVSIMEFAPGPNQTDEMFAAAWKANAATFANITCPCCGGQFRLEDDGVDVGSGGFVLVKNVSKPRINSLSLTTGARTGGEALYINGSSLDIGALAVKFNGKPALAITNRTATRARVVTPIGEYKLLIEERLAHHELRSITGTFLVGDTVSTAARLLGVLRDIEGASYLIGWRNLTTTAKSLVGTRVESSSGGSAIIATGSLPSFIDGEALVGQRSGARAVARNVDSLVAAAPSAAFVSGEIVRGGASGACVLLSGLAPYTGVVDVSVENEYGQRVVGGVVKNGFTYL